MFEYAFALGSNSGDSRKYCTDAVAQVAAAPTVSVTAVSSLVQTAAVGGPVGQRDF